MIVDAIAMLLLLLFALAGFRWGGMSQVMIGAIALTALLSASVFAPFLEPALRLLVPEAGAAWLTFWSTLCAGLLFFVLLCALAGRGITLIREGSFLLRGLDGLLGLVIGATIGACFALLVAWALWSGRSAGTLPEAWVSAVDGALVVRLLAWLHGAPMHGEFAPPALSMVVS